MKNLDFSSNVNPIGPPKEILEQINLEKLISAYPDHTNKLVIESLSSYYYLPHENLAVGSGSTEFFFILPAALNIETGIVINPTFWEYEKSLKYANKTVRHFRNFARNEFQIDFEKLRDMLSITNRDYINNALYLCQPSNPTSTLTNPKKILELSENFPSVKFVVDETYLLFRQDYPNLSLMKEATEHKNLIVITSFSKFFTVPGVRIGMCCSNIDNIGMIRERQIPYGVNSIAQNLIPCLLESKEFISDSRQFMDGERKRVYQLFKKNPHLHPYEPQANFILIKLKDTNNNSTDIVKYLSKKGIIIRDGSEFIGLGNQYLRFSIRTKEENNFLVSTLNDYNFKTKPS